MKKFIGCSILAIAGAIALAKYGSASEAYEWERVALSTVTASGFTVGKTTGTDAGNPACEALVTVEGGAARFRVDGTAATATAGHLVQANDSILLTSQRDIRAASFCKNLSVEGSTITVTFFKGCKK